MNDSSVDDDDRDARIAEILEQMLLSSSRGESIDLQRFTDRNPELADEIRRLWGTARMVTAVTHDTPSSSDSSKSLPTELELPCMFGPYELLAEIGRGGMGIVYRARDTSLKRIVAVKMLLRGSFASGEDMERFIQEARAVAGLNHPGILPVYEFGEIQGRLYFSMPLIDGETLGERLTRGPLSAPAAAQIVSSIAAAVAHAHERHILHRDLKPSNILLSSDGDVFVTDFGLARPARESISITRTGAVLGTPAFMSPEQAAGDSKRLTPASDVYSLGCILYNATTGQPPFSARSPVELIIKVIEQEAAPPRSIEPTIPRPLELVILRCLQKPVDLRYETASQLASDLEAFLRGDPVSANRGELTEFFSRMFRETHHAPILRNWGGLWMLNGIALLIVAILSDIMRAWGIHSRVQYFSLWTIGLGTWAFIFWSLRRKMGSITFVERQIAHVWMGGLAIIFMLVPLEYVIGLKIFAMAPILAAATGMAFFVKAGSLTGTFYVQAALLFATSFLMALFPQNALTLFGLVSGLAFFVPGWQQYRLKKRDRQQEQARHELSLISVNGPSALSQPNFRVADESASPSTGGIVASSTTPNPNP